MITIVHYTTGFDVAKKIKIEALPISYTIMALFCDCTLKTYVLPRTKLSLHSIFSKRDLAERKSACHLIAILICPFPFGYYDFLILQCNIYWIFEVPKRAKSIYHGHWYSHTYIPLKSYKLKSTWGLKKSLGCCSKGYISDRSINLDGLCQTW